MGTYTEMTGATSLDDCVPAPRGTFAAGTGNDGFTPCPGGTYQNETGQGACKVRTTAAAVGLWLAGASDVCLGAAERCALPALPCHHPVLTRLAASTPHPCPPQNCPPGHECPTGAVQPRQCKPGFFADLKQPWCRECPKGTFQPSAAQRACKPCPAGAYCAATKMRQPTQCPAGTFNGKLSSTTPTSCARCPINSVAANPGSTACAQCPSGQWTGRQTGQKVCWATSQALPSASAGRRRRVAL